jgi:hypothetical protein
MESPDEIEGYVLGAQARRKLEQQHRLLPVNRGRHNIVIREVPEGIDRFDGAAVAPPLAVAIDLLDTRDPRAATAARDLAQQILGRS